MERMRRLVRLILVCLVAALAAYSACQWAVLRAAKDMAAWPSSELSHAPAVLVLGASVLRNGQPSDILADRLKVAADVYAAGLADKVLASGDNGNDGYDEVNAMRRYLLEAGVAPEDIFLDHVGFDTYDSVYRARHVFGVTDVIVVTQSYHLPRALYLAEAVGIRAQGVSSDLQPYVKQRWFSARESLARIKAVGEALFDPAPKYLGDPIDITGDGRATWDEQS
jgi:vancomycin permeability regulator SanA